MPARKATPTPAVPVAPGPTQLEVRVNGKIVFLQRVYGYTIDQESDQFAVYGSLRPAETSGTLSVSAQASDSDDAA